MTPECKIVKEVNGRLSQGDVIRNVHFIEDVIEEGGAIEVKRIQFPCVIVLSQDCDLQQDFGVRWPVAGATPKDQDKRILSALVAPLYNADHFFKGEHLSDLGLTMQSIPQGKTKGKAIMNNSDPRYHYINFPASAQLVKSVVDFKHYFSVNVEYLKRIRPTSYVCKVAELYREDLCHRFSSFLARIGLPNPSENECDG